MSEIIVVVDDDAAMLRLVELILRRFQYTVITLDNPVKALELLDSVTPDLFILDMMMPQINGVELGKRIRMDARVSQVPIIMVSAMSELPDQVKGLEGIADAFLCKKTMHRDLIGNIHKLLSKTADCG